MFSIGGGKQRLREAEARKEELEKEVEALQAQLVEAQAALDACARERDLFKLQNDHANRQAAMSLRSEVSLNNIRNRVGEGATRLLSQQRHLSESSSLFSQSTVFLESVRDQVAEVASAANSGSATVQRLDEAVQPISSLPIPLPRSPTRPTCWP